MKNIATAVQLALAGSVALTSGNVLAQDSTNESADVEKIQVTGSRISRQGAIAPSPVTAISGESLLNSGAMNIGEVLNELPSLANTFSLGNSGQSRWETKGSTAKVVCPFEFHIEYRRAVDQLNWHQSSTPYHVA